MFGGHRLRLAVAVSLGVVCFAAAALAAVGGTYTGSSRRGFTITIQAGRTKVSVITIACQRGAIMVQSSGPAARIANDRFTYEGRERSTLSTQTTLRMKVTGTFTNSGRRVSGSASTDAQCKRGGYTASK